MLIAKRVFKRDHRWWESQTCRTFLCYSRLTKVFDIPENVKQITAALYTTPGPQRVRMRYLPNNAGDRLLTVSDGTLQVSSPYDIEDYDVEARDEELPEIRKSKRKIFYAEVSWEE